MRTRRRPRRTPRPASQTPCAPRGRAAVSRPGGGRTACGHGHRAADRAIGRLTSPKCTHVQADRCALIAVAGAGARRPDRPRRPQGRPGPRSRKPPPWAGRSSWSTRPGRTVDRDVLKGKWSAVFFGFTYCPDVCPTTLSTLAPGRAAAGPEGQGLADGVRLGRPRPRHAGADEGLPGQRRPSRSGRRPDRHAAQVDAAAKAYQIYYQKDGEGADYTVNHSAYQLSDGPQGPLRLRRCPTA